MTQPPFRQKMVGLGTKDFRITMDDRIAVVYDETIQA